MEKTKRQWKNKQNWLMCLVMLIFCGLLCLLPDEHLNITSRFPREKVRIEQVDNSMLDAIGIVYNGVQPCRVKILTGDYAGEAYQSYNYLNSALDKDKLFEAGDIAWAMIQPGSGQGAPVVTLIDHYRITAEAGIVALLALLLIGFGGRDWLRRDGVAGRQCGYRLETVDSTADGRRESHDGIVRDRHRADGAD